MPKKNRRPLPALALGASRAKVDLTPQAMQDRVENLTNWVTRQDALPHDAEFEYQADSVRLGSLQLFTVSSTPTTMKVDAPTASVVIPFSGQFRTRVGGASFDYAATETALLMPQGLRDTEAGVKSSLIIIFDEARLRKTIAAITGKDKDASKRSVLNLDNPQLFKLRTGNLEFDRVFLNWCQLVDKFHGQDAALEALGVSDSFYRGLAVLMNQQYFLQPEADQTVDCVKRVCDYIEDHLHENITLTQLELVSTLSARALQYAFTKRLGCTPLSYLRSRKVHYARELLMHPTETTTVAAVALCCGYHHLGRFSAHYAAIFNEYPSETLKNALK